MVNKEEEYRQRTQIIDSIVKKNNLTEWEEKFIGSCRRHFRQNKELTTSMRHYYLEIMERYNYGK